MASAQDCDPKRGEPPSTASPQSVEVRTWRERWWYGNNREEPSSTSSAQSVEVRTWRERWWYGNNGVGDEIMKSVDYQTDENRIVRAPVNGGNPKTNRFVIVFCYIV